MSFGQPETANKSKEPQLAVKKKNVLRGTDGYRCKVVAPFY